jgi:hypothetical protein
LAKDGNVYLIFLAIIIVDIEYSKAMVVDLQSNKVKVKVKQSRYRPGVAQRVPGS